MQNNGETNGNQKLQKETIANENQTMLAQPQHNGFSKNASGNSNGHLLLVPVPMEPERRQLRSPRTERTVVDIIEKADADLSGVERKTSATIDEPVNV